MIQFDQQSGFVAGTLVHTDKGLIPIDQIKVGDLVLSKNEIGEGELAYKPVLQTSATENVLVCFARFTPKALDNLPVFKLRDQSLYADVLVTLKHPFWIVDKGWMSTDLIKINNTVLLRNQDIAYCQGGDNGIGIEVIFKTDKLEVGFVPDFGGEDDSGRFVNLETGSHVSYGSYHPIFKKLYLSNKQWKEQLLEQIPEDGRDGAEFFGFRQGGWQDPASATWSDDEGSVTTTVYNFEVADTHNYFVTKQGILVHDASTNIS